MITHRGASVGKPIAHSLSPVLHNAAYAALGLSGWHYDRRECAEDEFADFLNTLGPEWVGLSVTMPLKRVALAAATEVSPRAAAIGAANTLILTDGKRFADNTDALGMIDALAEAGLDATQRAIVLGAGGTAQAALSAVAELTSEPIVLAVRAPQRAAAAQQTAARIGVPIQVRQINDLPLLVRQADLVISTLPPGAADSLAGLPFMPGVVVFDVVYQPWPTRFAQAAAAAGARIVSGLEMLLHQATYQVTAMTGQPAPLAAMRAALYAAVPGYSPSSSPRPTG